MWSSSKLIFTGLWLNIYYNHLLLLKAQRKARMMPLLCPLIGWLLPLLYLLLQYSISFLIFETLIEYKFRFCILNCVHLNATKEKKNPKTLVVKLSKIEAVGTDFSFRLTKDLLDRFWFQGIKYQSVFFFFVEITRKIQFRI